MSTDVIAAFEDSLGESATADRTNAASFQEDLDDHVDPPAIGVPLPFEGVSLPAGVVPPESAEDLRTARTGVTPAGVGIAEYGTVTVQSRYHGDELVSLYPERHVAVVAASDVLPDAEAAFDRFDREFRDEEFAAPQSQVLESGPSTTADMGGLVEGVHGPREVHVVILEDR